MCVYLPTPPHSQDMKHGQFFKYMCVYVCVYIYICIRVYVCVHSYIYVCVCMCVYMCVRTYIFFYHTTCESTCDTLPSSAANQGDNTVSVAQGSTTPPGATNQLLPLDRVKERNIYTHTHTHIYICARSTKSRDYIGRSIIFIFSAVCDLKTRLHSVVDIIATVA